MISTDGRYLISLASPNDNYELKVWRLPSAKLTGHVTGLGLWPGLVAASERVVISGPRLYKVPTGELLRELKGDLAAETDLSPDGRWAVHAGKRLCLWDTTTGELKARISLKRAPYTVHVSPNGKLAQTRSSTGITMLWDLESGKPIPGGEAIRYAEFAPDLKHMIVTCTGHSFDIWNIEKLRVAKSVPFPLYESAITPDNHFVASSKDSRLGVWSIQSGKQLGHARQGTHVYEVAATNAQAIFTYDRKTVRCFA